LRQGGCHASGGWETEGVGYGFDGRATGADGHLLPPEGAGGRHRSVEVDERFYRPTEVALLLGGATNARKQLAWNPQTFFEALTSLLVEYACHLADRVRQIPDLLPLGR